MPSHAGHRLRFLGDRHLLQALVVASVACVFSAGLVYVGYFVHVLRIAHRAPCLPVRDGCLLLFGKHAPQGRIDRDFAARLDRAVSLLDERPGARMVLLGGGARGQTSEAEVARQGLFARGVARDAPLQLEAASRDTFQNLRNARQVLASAEFFSGPKSGAPVGDPALAPLRLPVTLLSNRYHLARCALFARQLGFNAELCAAETRLHWGPRTLLLVAGEAAYVCLSDVGMRWARLIGHRAMLERVS